MQDDMKSTEPSLPTETTTKMQRLARRLDERLVLAARSAAVAVSLALWTMLLPLWLFMVLRAVIVYGTLNVLSAFSGHGAIDPQRFESVVQLWPTGVSTLCSVLSGDFEPRPVATEDDLRLLLTETAALIVVILTVVIGHIVVGVFAEILPIVATAVHAAVGK